MVVAFWKCYLTYENISYSRECFSYLCVLSWLVWVLVLYLAKILSLFYGSTEVKYKRYGIPKKIW